jgi:hypothetical protein
MVILSAKLGKGTIKINSAEIGSSITAKNDTSAFLLLVKAVSPFLKCANFYCSIALFYIVKLVS